MRAVLIEKPGDVGVLRVGERASREPNPGEVRIRVAAAAVNPTDILVRERGAGRLPTPWTPGMDAAGTVESVGTGVTRLAVGDRVVAAVTPQREEGGAQQELLVLPVASVVRLPASIPLAAGATLPMNGLTARFGLSLLGLGAGQTLAVTGSAGLLGSYVIALAKEQGLRVVADAKPADIELVRGFGADVVVARGDAFVDEVLAAVPGGVDALFDCALLHEAAFPAVRDGGAVVVVRGWDGRPVPRGIAVHPVFVAKALERTDWLEELVALAAAGKLALRVAGEFPVDRVAEAYRAMEAGGLRGRAVLVFDAAG